MQTVPDAILDQIARDQPHLAVMVNNLRAHPERAIQIERALAYAYMSGPCTLKPIEVWYLAQVAHGGPWGGDWVTTTYAAGQGYSDAHLRRLAAEGKVRAIKRGKVWYVRREDIPHK